MSNKIKNDKYYTSKELAKYCLDKTFEIIGKENITEIIESSAGNGVFLDYITDIPYKAYDIEPEDERIKEQDFLTLNLDYKKGRLVGFNPPFGTRNKLSIKFFKKAIQFSDYISFILPISQLNNTKSIFEFDLIYSEDLGVKKYTDRLVHCCLNIYKRPSNGQLNKCNLDSLNYTKLEDVELRAYIRGRNYTKYNNFKDYDYAFCKWGSKGKQVQYYDQFANSIYIKIKNNQYKDEIIDFLKKYDFKKLSPSISESIKFKQVYSILKERFPELK